jgi:MFS family permease
MQARAPADTRRWHICLHRCSIPAALTKNMWVIQASLWWVLFFGGAVLSPATGVVITTVSPDLRALSCSISMFCYNIFGYAAAPYLCGLLAEHVGLRAGFQMVLLTSTVVFLGMLGAWRVSVAEDHQLASTQSNPNPIWDFDSPQSADTAANR